jgi:hypothetical protein
MLKSSEPQNKMRSGSDVRDGATVELYRRCGVTIKARIEPGSLQNMVQDAKKFGN